MSNEVQMSVRLNRQFYAATGQPQLAYALVQATPAANIAVPRSLNFCFVLDHSGSMAGAKLTNLKSAVKLALDLLGPNDYVSVIEFDDNVRVLGASQPATPSNLSSIRNQIDRMNDAGGTLIAKGMKMGLAELQKQLSQTRVNRMLLLTDGQTGDEADCSKQAEAARSQGISVAAYGLGEDWNEKLLEDIAATSGGTANFVQTPDALAQEFNAALRQAQGEVVQNAELLMRLVKGVFPRAAWKLTPQISKLNHKVMSDRDVTVPIGALDAQQGAQVLVELMLPARTPGAYRMAQADLSYDVPASGLVGQHAVADVMLTFTADAQQSELQDVGVAELVRKVSAFNLQTRALDDMKTGNLGAATQKLRAAATQLLDMGETDLATVALKEAENLQAQGKMSDLGTKKLSYGTRKLTQKLD